MPYLDEKVAKGKYSLILKKNQKKFFWLEKIRNFQLYYLIRGSDCVRNFSNSGGPMDLANREKPRWYHTQNDAFNLILKSDFDKRYKK